eukprot:scaffold1809_cov386-Prasinococcus_capsulatus_cf.AAC.34
MPMMASSKVAPARFAPASRSCKVRNSPTMLRSRTEDHSLSLGEFSEGGRHQHTFPASACDDRVVKDCAHHVRIPKVCSSQGGSQEIRIREV